MPSALSEDLHARVVAAALEGAKHRDVGVRFGVSAATVSRWRALEREQGDVRARPAGGDRRSGRIEAHKGVILALPEATPDLTIEEFRLALADTGVTVGYGTIRRFFARHGITRKTYGPPASRADPTS
jgi:transposase